MLFIEKHMEVLFIGLLGFLFDCLCPHEDVISSWMSLAYQSTNALPRLDHLSHAPDDMLDSPPCFNNGEMPWKPQLPIASHTPLDWLAIKIAVYVAFRPPCQVFADLEQEAWKNHFPNFWSRPSVRFYCSKAA